MFARRQSAAEKAELELEKQAQAHARGVLTSIHAVFNELDIGDVWNVSNGHLVFWITKTGAKSMTIHSGGGSYLVQVRNEIIMRLRRNRYRVTVQNTLPKRRR